MQRGRSNSARVQSFEELYHDHYQKLVAFFGRRGIDPEESRDLAQETMLRAYRGLAEFEHRSQVKTWLLQIAVNLAQNWFRDRHLTQKRGAEETSLDAAHEDGQQFPESRSIWGEERFLDPEQLASDRQFKARVYEVMTALSPRQRECLALWLEGHKYREIAERLGISLQSVRSILNQAKERIRQELGDDVRSKP